MAGKHGCIGTNKRGEPCGSKTLKDRDICISHLSKEEKESRGFGGSQPGAGRPRLPKPLELARELVERHAIALLRPHFKAVGLLLNDDGTVTHLEHGAIVVHNGEATTIEDLGAQIAAAERLFDRVHGKPKQATEVTGAGGEPLGAVFVTDPKLSEDARALLRRAASASGNQSRRAGAGDE